MKKLLLGLALAAGVCACASQKDSVSDATKANGAKVECQGACEGSKSECCSEKAKGTCTEGKTCPGMTKVQG